MEEKRRLPSWMKGASTAGKPIDLDAKSIITEEEVNVGNKSSKPKAKALTRKNKKEVCPSSDEKSFLVKCETKRKKIGIVEKDVIEPHDPEQEVVVEKKKLQRGRRKVEEPDHSRTKEEDTNVRKKLQRGRRKVEESDHTRTKEENTTQSSDEDDDDLTMDDLLSIAKQFVENDKRDTGQQKSSEGLLKRNSSHSSSVNTTSPISPQDDKPPIQEEKSEVILEGKTMTGDPAQDMLDLFLGPLLKKPKRTEEGSSIKDMIIPHEVKNEQHDAVVFNKPVTLTKKKSSLRDAVAMLLD